MKKIKHLNFFIFLIIFLLISCTVSRKIPVVENGFINLSSWKFKTDGLIALKGELKFNWNKDIKPLNPSGFNDTEWDRITVPSTWTNKTGSGTGFAWYALQVELPENREDLFLYMKRSNTAFNVYVDNNLVLKNGKPGNTKKKTIPEYRTVTGKLPPGGKTILITQKISNFHSANGGSSFPLILKELYKKIW